MNNQTGPAISGRIKSHLNDCSGEWYITGHNQGGQTYEICTKCKKVLCRVDEGFKIPANKRHDHFWKDEQ